jgi:hypothetical protein
MQGCGHRLGSIAAARGVPAFETVTMGWSARACRLQSREMLEGDAQVGKLLTDDRDRACEFVRPNDIGVILWRVVAVANDLRVGGGRSGVSDREPQTTVGSAKEMRRTETRRSSSRVSFSELMIALQICCVEGVFDGGVKPWPTERLP